MTENDGICPVCGNMVWSDFDDPKAGMSMHISIKHPEEAEKRGLLTPDPEHPGWSKVKYTENDGKGASE